MSQFTRSLAPNHRVSVSNPSGGALTQDASVTLKPGDTLTITAQAPAPPPPPTSIRAACVYTWYPNTWTVNGKHVFYHPTAGYYDSADTAIIDGQIAALDYAKVQVALMSWWGQGQQRENLIMPLWQSRIAAKNSPLKMGFYYEKEGFGNPSVAEISGDLAYLKANYGGATAYKPNGKPLTVFVYNADDSTAEVCQRWSAANGVGAYIGLKVFPNFQTASPQPDAWHQYGPASREQNVGTTFSISPGFWRADEATARLSRDPVAWKQNVRDMVNSGVHWNLITTFNEWGEGTAVESATEWSSASGFGTYLDALHTDGA